MTYGQSVSGETGTVLFLKYLDPSGEGGMKVEAGVVGSIVNSINTKTDDDKYYHVISGESYINETGYNLLANAYNSNKDR